MRCPILSVSQAFSTQTKKSEKKTRNDSEAQVSEADWYQKMSPNCGTYTLRSSAVKQEVRKDQEIDFETFGSIQTLPKKLQTSSF